MASYLYQQVKCKKVFKNLS